MNDYEYTGIQLTENSEGCRLTPYKDGAGVWSNGWGNTFNVHPDVTITMDQAIADLKTNLASAEATVKNDVKVELTQGEYNSLVDFVFNLGSGNFAGSTLLKKINAGDYAGAALEFPKWDHCAGEVSQGLLNRRLAEQAEFDQQGA